MKSKMSTYVFSLRACETVHKIHFFSHLGSFVYNANKKTFLLIKNLNQRLLIFARMRMILKNTYTIPFQLFTLIFLCYYSRFFVINKSQYKRSLQYYCKKKKNEINVIVLLYRIFYFLNKDDCFYNIVRKYANIFLTSLIYFY